MAGVPGSLETWAALTLVVCLGLYGVMRYRVRSHETPELGEGAQLIGLLLAVGYLVATATTGLPFALLYRAAHLPDGLAVLAAAAPLVVGLWAIVTVPEYVALAHHERPDALSSRNALRALTVTGWFVLTWFGWLVLGAAAVAQFGAIVGAVAGAVGYLLLRDWYSCAQVIPHLGTIREPTAAEADRVRTLLGGALPDGVPIRVLETDDSDVDAEDGAADADDAGTDTDPDYADMRAGPVGPPGRRRFLIDERLLDADERAAEALVALTVAQLRGRAVDWLFAGRVLQLAVIFSVVGVVVPQVPPTVEHVLVPAAALFVALLVLAGLERLLWRRIYALDRRAADAAGTDAVAALLADYDGPPGDDRFAEFVHLHPSARRRLARLGVSEAPAAGDSAADSA